MRKRMSAIVVALLVLTGVASAQETSGTLTGKLVDTQGLAVPGATVTVTGTQGAKTFVSDEDGRFQAPFLTPGMYDVRAELQGFKVVDVTGVGVSLGQTTDLAIKMEVGGLTETIEVVGSNVIIDTGSTTTGAVLSSEMLARIPVGRRFSDTLYLAPGVSSGGSVGRANPSVSGGSGLDNAYIVDGVNVTNTGYGALGSYSIVFGSLGNATPYDFIKEVQVKTGGYEAEFGQSLGGVINVVTKSGSNSLRGSLFGYTQPKALEGEWKMYQAPNGTVNTVATQRSDFGIEAGGRIVRDRVFFFGAINPGWDQRTFIAPEGFPLESLGEVDRKRTSLSYSAKGTFQVNSQNRLDASFFGDPSKGEMGPQRTSSLIVDDTSSFSQLNNFGGHNQTVKYEGALSSNWLLEGTFARAFNAISETPSVNDHRVTDQTGPVTRTTGGIGLYEAGNESLNMQYAAKTTFLFGDHQLKGGILFEDVEYSQVNQRTGPTFTSPDGRQTATGASITVLNDVNFGRIWRVTRANFNDARVTTQEYFSFFVQDQWKAGDRLTVNAGVRYEEQTLVGTFQELFTLDGQSLPDFPLKNNWAPRVGFVFDVLGNGRSKLFANYGRYFARIPNDLAARALSADDGVSRIDYFDAALTRPIPDGTATQVPGQGQITQHYIPAGVGADLIDPEAKLSYQDELIAGYEWEAMPNTSIGVRYIYRNVGRVLEDIADAPVVSYDLGLTTGVDYILTNPGTSFPTRFPQLGASFEDPKHTYSAVELTFDKRFSNNWMFLGSYRFSRLFGTFEGFYREDNGQSDPGITSLYDFPTNDPSYTSIGVPQFSYRGDIRFLGALGEGPLPLDRPHQVKLYGSYAFTNGLAIGIGSNFSSGKPLTALASLAPYDNDSEIPESPRGDGFETIDGFKKRTPMEAQIDLQASYALDFGGRKITLLADAFNLFNIRRTLDYNAATEQSFLVLNPDFGTPTSQNVAGQQFQPPFSLRIGARFAW